MKPSESKCDPEKIRAIPTNTKANTKTRRNEEDFFGCN
jgi:hypothetical protein